MTQFNILSLGTVGAEVRGLDLSRVTPDEFHLIERAWLLHDVLIFRDQVLTDKSLIAFSKRFGDLDPPPVQGAGQKSVPGYPDVYVVSNVLDEKGEPIGALGDGEAAWHTDMSYLAKPPDASMLYALEVPSVGGDTWFASMKAAFAALPDELRSSIKDLDIKHDGTYDSGGNLRKGVAAIDDPRLSPGQSHPVAIEHPLSGENSLYLGRRRNAYVVGLELKQSEQLLNTLWSYVETSVYRHKWSVGDLVLWDNRTTMHRRDGFDPKSRRVMHRTQIKGSAQPQRAEF